MTSGHNHWQEDAGSLPMKTGGQILLHKLRLVQLLTHLSTAFIVVQTDDLLTHLNAVYTVVQTENS